MLNQSRMFFALLFLSIAIVLESSANPENKKELIFYGPIRYTSAGTATIRIVCENTDRSIICMRIVISTGKFALFEQGEQVRANAWIPTLNRGYQHILIQRISHSERIQATIDAATRSVSHWSEILNAPVP